MAEDEGLRLVVVERRIAAAESRGGEVGFGLQKVVLLAVAEVHGIGCVERVVNADVALVRIAVGARIGEVIIDDAIAVGLDREGTDLGRHWVDAIAGDDAAGEWQPRSRGRVVSGGVEDLRWLIVEKRIRKIAAPFGGGGNGG